MASAEFPISIMKRPNAHTIRLLIPCLALALGSSGCKLFQRATAPGPPYPTYPPSVYEYGYESYSVREPIEVPIGTATHLNLVTGLLTATGQGFPHSEMEARQPNYFKIAQATAMRK